MSLCPRKKWSSKNALSTFPRFSSIAAVVHAERMSILAHSLTAEQLTNLQALAASGATSVTIGDQTIAIDGDRIDRMLADAKRTDLTSRVNGRAMETLIGMDMTGFIS